MEAQVLEQDDLSVASFIHSLLDLLANAVLGKGHAGAQQLLELGNNRLETVLRVGLTVWPAEVAHEDNGFGAIVACVLDGGECADDALVVGDLLVGVERDVEVDLEIAPLEHVKGLRVCVTETYTNEDALALQVDVADRKLVGERHIVTFVRTVMVTPLVYVVKKLGVRSIFVAKNQLISAGRRESST